jgi:hypothetical protein
MKSKKSTLVLFSLLLIGPLLTLSCGDPNLDLTEVQYEPKIVVAGYLYPGRAVDGIRIYRNFPLNTPIDTLSIIVKDASVSINNIPLKYDPFTFSYYNESITVQGGTTYTLRVSGTIDGKALATSSSTTTPAPSFKLVNKNLGTFHYGEEFPIRFIPDCNATFYAFLFSPAVATLDNFIYDNNYIPNIDPEELELRLGTFQNMHNFILHVLPGSVDTAHQTVRGMNTWFYTDYKTIIYAGDDNFKHFVLSGKNVQELDGNFHEPIQHFTGDGIGVFASAVADTVYFKIIK